MKKIKFFKQFSVFFLIVGALTVMGFGCKGITAEQQQATKPVSLEYWTVYDDVDALNAQIVKYRAERPYLTVNLRQLRSDELYSRLVEALAEDKGPDIISVQARDLRAFQSKLAPMLPSVSDTIVRTQKNIVGQVETIITTQAVALPTVFQIDREFVQTVKKDAIIGGKIYCLPLSLDTMAIYYNKDLLDRSDVAEPPTTWEQFQEAVRKIVKLDKDKTRILQAGAALGTGNNIANADDILYILFKQSGVDFISSNNRAVFNTAAAGGAAAASVMDFYTDFANPARDTYTWNEGMDDSLDSFVKGETAFYFGYSFNNSQIKARAPQLNYGILPMLQLDPEKSVNVANYWLQCVVAKSGKQNEAWGLLNYLTRSSATEEYLTQTKRPTALRNLVNKQKENIELAPFVSQILVADSWYRGGDYAAAAQAIKDMTAEWLNVPLKFEDRVPQWQADVLNRGASKINQTLK
ncbi:MAG: extracellular solute-binding protein [Patescibacteria group bacterium]|nr:extracellular solute-binding protein [Patescibacteria group bacterium]